MYKVAPIATRVVTTTIAVSITLKLQKHKTDLAYFKYGISKMDYHSMELTELKTIAKERIPKIKHYYIMSRAQLIQVLLMDKLPEQMILEKKTLKVLQAEAKVKGVPKVWSLRRHQLIEILYPRSESTLSPKEKN
jgi:hypothetical protein